MLPKSSFVNGTITQENNTYFSHAFPSKGLINLRVLYPINILLVSFQTEHFAFLATVLGANPTLFWPSELMKCELLAWKVLFHT